jgi:hypothetical protein
MSQLDVNVDVELFDLGGQRTGFAARVNVPPSGQVSYFLDELFPGLPATVQGTLRITPLTSLAAPAPIAVIGIRGKYNERGDFLITATPASDERLAVSSKTLVFPHVVSGGGYATRLFLYSDSVGASPGRLYYTNQNGLQMPQGSLSTTQP